MYEEGIKEIRQRLPEGRTPDRWCTCNRYAAVSKKKRGLLDEMKRLSKSSMCEHFFRVLYAALGEKDEPSTLRKRYRSTNKYAGLKD